jgi:hypothetical protein
MAGTFMQIDDREFKAALLRFYASQKKSWPEVIKSQARLIAVNFAHQTAPFGMAKATRDQAQKTIGVEIGRVYKEAGTVAYDLKNSSKSIAEVPRVKSASQAAAAFVRLVRNAKHDKARQLLNDLMIDPYQATQVGKFDQGGEHQKARYGARRKVPKNQFPRMAVTNFNVIRSYMRKVKDRVGTAKAGWAACAKELGGWRGIPAWVHQQTSKRRLGGVDDATAGKNPHVIMTNSVPWIDKCLNQGQMQRAIDIQKQKMISAIGHSMSRSARAMGF